MKITPEDRIQLHNLASIGLAVISLLLMLVPLGKISRLEYLVVDMALKKDAGAGKAVFTVLEVVLCAAAVYAVMSVLRNRGLGLGLYFGLNCLLVCVDIFLVLRIWSRLSAYMEYVDAARNVLKWVEIEDNLALITLAKNIFPAAICAGAALVSYCTRPKKKSRTAAPDRKIS